MKAPARRAEILAALEAAGGNVTRTATALGITRQTLYRHIDLLGLQREFGIRADAEDPRPPVHPHDPDRDLDHPITVKVPTSLWVWTRIEALNRRTTASAIVKEALERLRAGK